MKKITLVVLISFLSFNLYSQSWFGKKIKGNGNQITMERNVEEYDDINISGAFDIELLKGDEGNLTISIDENLKDYLVTKIKGNTLIIRWKREYKVRPKHIVQIQIPFKKIEGISLAGSGSIRNKDVIVANDFEIELAGSGNIDLELDTRDTDCSLAGSGTVVLTGNTDNFDCSKAGSGSLAAYGFICNTVDISSAGSGNAEVFVAEFLKADIAGSGNIHYKGDPKHDSLRVAGSGKILMK